MKLTQEQKQKNINNEVDFLIIGLQAEINNLKLIKDDINDIYTIWSIKESIEWLFDNVNTNINVEFDDDEDVEKAIQEIGEENE